jgi:predicted house-cleaning noncanonical NTP pyrophosphatase (MazG superfamily)
MVLEDNLNKIFDIEPSKKEDSFELAVINPTIIVPEIVSDAEKDIQKAKAVHYDLINKSSQALEELMEFAKQAESPRAYEVVTGLIKTTSEVAKTLVDLNNSLPKKSEAPVQKNTQNNIFLGSTAELQKLLKGSIEDPDSDDEDIDADE